MKKFFALALALVMALSLTTAAWGAAYTYNGSNTGDATVVLTDGQVYDGANATVTQAGTGSYDAGIAMQGTGDFTIENVTIVSPTRGIETGEDIVSTNIEINNVVIENSKRAIHVQTQSAGNLTVTDSVIAGKVSFVLRGGVATFINCTFKTNGLYEDCLEPWSEVVFINCEFEEGYAVSFEDWNNVAADSDKAIAMTNCTYDGEPLTADNMDELFTNTTGVDVDDVATVAHAVDGATKIFSGLYAKGTGAGATIGAASLYYFKAVAPVYDAETGVVTNQPSIAYYLCPELTGTTYLAEVTSLGAADVVTYIDVDGKVVHKYLEIVDNVEYEGNGVPFVNFGKACGQYKDANYDKTATYYTFENVVYKAVEFSATALMVNGKLVPVEPATGAFVEHIASYTYNDKFEVTAVKCGVCGTPAVIYPNLASVPQANRAKAVLINDNDFYVWAAGPVASTDKTVQSAQTFDAGIAMYVGMSVMAAAGGAVVIGKKKD